MRSSEYEATQNKPLVEVHQLERKQEDKLDTLVGKVKDDNSKVKELMCYLQT